MFLIAGIAHPLRAEPAIEVGSDKELAGTGFDKIGEVVDDR